MTSKHTPGPRPSIVDVTFHICDGCGRRHLGAPLTPSLAHALERLVSVSKCQQWGACNAPRNSLGDVLSPVEERCPACEARTLLARVDGGGK
jgi:hypothetical protein